MVYTPGSFYGGALPEKDALVASNLTAIETRENGGIALIDQIHRERMGVMYLGWFDSGVCYNLWTRNEPTFDADGNLEVDGLRLRGNAVYNAFFTNYLQAQVIDLPTGDVYTALQNGVVDATGWTQIGLIDLRWNEFLNYRIEPCFFSTDLGVIINLETWDSLTPEAQEILQSVAIQHEIDSVNALGCQAGRGFRRAGRTGHAGRRTGRRGARQLPRRRTHHHVGADARADGGKPRAVFRLRPADRTVLRSGG
jgi:TRAP-type mannitol/chloroaromatic compound transport system substrate-binding protein